MKHEKFKLENSKNIFVSKCCPWEKTPKACWAEVILVNYFFHLFSVPCICFKTF